MQTLNYDGLRMTDKKSHKVKDALVIEAALQININNLPYTVIMRTPGDDSELIRGLLFTEDIYKNKENLNLEYVENHANGFSIINVKIDKKNIRKGYLNKRTLLSVSSCGICGKQKLEDIKYSGPKIIDVMSFNTAKLEDMFNEMHKRQETFEISGGSHAAALFSDDYTILTLKEDIGRHNAVDKVIGKLLDNNSLNQAKYMLVSGRVSYEIISKAFMAKIPVVAAVSACSSLAVDFSKEFGICLVGFSRGKKATIYTN